MVTRLSLIEQLISAGGATRGDRNVRHSNLACSKGCSDIPIFGGEYEEYEEWQYKVRIFLNSECPLFAKFFTYLEGLDREVDEEDVREYGEGRDFEGNTADVVWMNQQLFNILAQKTKGNPFQTVKNMAVYEGCSGAGAWVKLLRAYKGYVLGFLSCCFCARCSFIFRLPLFLFSTFSHCFILFRVFTLCFRCYAPFESQPWHRASVSQSPCQPFGWSCRVWVHRSGWDYFGQGHPEG